MSRKAIIGTSSNGYAEQRNFSALPFEHYSFRKCQNLHKFPAHLYFKLKGSIHPYYWFSFRDFGLNRVGLFHFFNTLSYGNTPWICTFETSIPRWGKNKRLKKGLKLISNDACKRIIALSACAAQIQRDLISANYPEYSAAINDKMMVLHPAQEALIESYEDKKLSSKTTFTIIGRDFFRKGGLEVLRVFDRLFEAGQTQWQLNIVSTLDYGDYATFSTREAQVEALQIIKKHSSHIHHFEQLKNTEVLTLLRNSHVGLLPTYADSYGYSVLEAQACGCPCITTDIRALPEINNDDVGWSIKVPKNKAGNALIYSESDRSRFSQIIQEGLQSIIVHLLVNEREIIEKGKSALVRIKKEHSPANNARILEGIYDEILQRKTSTLD